jgi:hypothetical protein
MMRCRHVASWTVIAAPILAWVAYAALPVGSSVHANQTAKPLAQILKLGAARAGTLYGLTLAVKDPAQLQGSDGVRVTVNDAQVARGTTFRAWPDYLSAATMSGLTLHRRSEDGYAAMLKGFQWFRFTFARSSRGWFTSY